MSYQIIAEHENAYAVATMCRALEVSVSGYYAWRERKPSQHEQRDAELLTHIRQIYEQGRGMYGSPRVHGKMQERKIPCSRKRVARLMRENGLFSRRKVRYRARTTDSNHKRPIAPNLLKRDFSATAPNQKWVGDIVGIWTREGWLYLAALLDTYSRRIIGWAMSALRDEALVTDALRMALAYRELTTDLIHHTDRGSQFTADDYLALLAQHGISVSMSGKGDPYDNAMIESFFSTLRAECTEQQLFDTRAQARVVLFDFIEVFYNRQRIHSALGYLCPVCFEEEYSS
jgi:putative transposase